MTHNFLNGKLSKSQLNKLKSGTRNCTEATLNLSSNIISSVLMIRLNFPHKLLLAKTQVLRICKSFYKWFISEFVK